jgi:putative glutamine amidotransferase
MKNVSRPIIGILGVPTYDNESDSVIALFNDYKNAIVEKNCIPFMICPLLSIDYYETKLSDIPTLSDKEKEIYIEMVNMCDGLIIPGGYRMYEFDKFVVEYAIEKDIPILGICMGMQLLANIDNGNYCLAKNETEIEHRQRNVKYVHKVNILEDTILRSIINKAEINVNSKHRYHVEKVNQFKISAYSEDGLIEAIEYSDKKFVIGVQWHPEKMISYDEDANKLFDEFTKECKNNQKRLLK